MLKCNFRVYVYIARKADKSNKDTKQARVEAVR